MAAAVSLQGDLDGLGVPRRPGAGRGDHPRIGDRAGRRRSLLRRAQELVREVHPSLVHAWRLALRALDAAAVAYTGKPFHALSAHKQEELVVRWQVDPVLRTPLGILALVYKFAHFDRDDVYGRMGGKLNVVTSLEQPRWLSQVHRADDWSEGDVECDVVVVGHRRRRRGRRARARRERLRGGLRRGGRAPPPRRVRRPRGQRAPALLPGRLLGRERADADLHGAARRRIDRHQRGHVLPHARLGARSLVRRDRHRRVLPGGDGAPLRSGRAVPRGRSPRRATSSDRSPTSSRAGAMRSDGATSRSRATPPAATARASATSAAGRTRAAGRTSRTCRRPSARALSFSRGRASTASCSTRAGARRGVEAVTQRGEEDPRAGARGHPGGGRGADAAAASQAGARATPAARSGRNLSLAPEHGLRRGGRGADARPAGTSRRATAATSSCATASSCSPRSRTTT